MRPFQSFNLAFEEKTIKLLTNSTFVILKRQRSSCIVLHSTLITIDYDSKWLSCNICFLWNSVNPPWLIWEQVMIYPHHLLIICLCYPMLTIKVSIVVQETLLYSALIIHVIQGRILTFWRHFSIWLPRDALPLRYPPNIASKWCLDVLWLIWSRCEWDEYPLFQYFLFYS